MIPNLGTMILSVALPVTLYAMLAPLLGVRIGQAKWQKSGYEATMLVAALFMMLAVFGQIPLNDAIVGRYVADEYRARVIAVRYVVSLGVAAVAVPMIAALHRTEGGFGNVFFVLAALAGGMLLASFFFPSRAELTANKEKFSSRQAQAA